jgi:hypothetical protein
LEIGGVTVLLHKLGVPSLEAQPALGIHHCIDFRSL